MNSNDMHGCGIVLIILGVFLLFCNGGGVAALILFGIIGVVLLCKVPGKRDEEMRDHCHKTYGKENGERIYQNLKNLKKK